MYLGFEPRDCFHQLSSLSLKDFCLSDFHNLDKFLTRAFYACQTSSFPGPLYQFRQYIIFDSASGLEPDLTLHTRYIVPRSFTADNCFDVPGQLQAMLPLHHTLWLDLRDSNPCKQLQKLLCYHYTKIQSYTDIISIMDIKFRDSGEI